ncbi:choice-of-anchor I domain-containing protein [Blastococcus sp. SYSU DS1021]
MSPRARRLACTFPAAALMLAVTVAPAGAKPAPAPVFTELATFEVTGEVAEILAVTPDGRTLLYTDSATGEVGLVDLTRPAEPTAIGSVQLGGEPTSVTVTRDGRHALAVVDTSTSFTAPSGELAVIDLRTRAVVRTIDLGGQPDSIAISPDGAVAAVAIENQRDEDLEVDGVEGGLPQAPAGFLAVVELHGTPERWTVDRVELTGLEGALYPDDPEPEYVDIDRRGIAAVTLQENNAIALVDLRSRTVVGSFSAGTVTRTDADTSDDGVIAFDDALTAPREPDAVQWTPGGNLVTADEGDLAEEPSGGRGWTVFSPDGEVVSTSGGAAEQALAAAGRYPDGRSDDKGAEFEGAEVATLYGTTYAFIGSERGDAVLVYDLADEGAPELLQVLSTGEAPEGLLAVKRGHLFLTSNEDDGTISLFQLTKP